MQQENRFDQIPEELEPIPEVNSPEENEGKPRRVRRFNFWRGLQTTLGAAFIVATLFTLWTPGSLVESGLEARMAQVVDSASGGDEALVGLILKVRRVQRKLVSFQAIMDMILGQFVQTAPQKPR